MDFSPLDLDSPLDTAQRLREMPPDWPIKGIFFSTAISALREAHISSEFIKDYSALGTYRCTDLVKTLDSCSQLLYPELSPRATLVKLGHRVFPGLKYIPMGRVFYSMAVNNVIYGVKMTSRIYNLLSNTKAQILDYSNQMVIIRLTEAWVFPTCYHVGIYEGGIKLLGPQNVHSSVLEHDISTVDLKFEW